MRILFVCPYPLSPVKRRPLNFALHLAARHELHLRVLARPDEIRAYHRRWSDAHERLAAACASYEVLPVSLPRIAAGSVAGYAHGDASRVAYTAAHGRYAELLNRQCAALRIDVVHVDRLRLARLATSLTPPSVLDLPDCMSWATGDWASEASGPRAWFYAQESRRLRRFEGGELNDNQVVLVASDADAERLSASGYRGEARSIPGIIDLQEDDADEAVARMAKPLLVFHGHLAYPPNVDAVVAFVSNVFGALRASWPALQLAVVGVSPARAVRSLAAVDGVSVVANVKHMSPWLRAATAVIAPMRIGPGHSQKICEAMLTARPVICTPSVASRLAPDVRTQLLLAQTVDQWVEHVGSLIDNPERAAAMGEQNRRIAQQHYSPQVVLPLLEAAYAQVLK